ncbi:tyrosine-type recombinase/integrase [Spirillospora sp. NPDC048911]|uniref:tyrosine-type recombinase/integrase n=1 Tax=Spirillospora sp. NPDC048911 TaxID=3364527 RepID=UPI00371E2FA7
MFTNRNGEPVSPGWLTHQFQKLIAEQDVPPIRLHDLRHGAATLALAAGEELKVVQELLGYSSIVLTADTYTSVLPEVARTAAEKTAALLLQAAGIVPGTDRQRAKGPSVVGAPSRGGHEYVCHADPPPDHPSSRRRVHGLEYQADVVGCSASRTIQ